MAAKSPSAPGRAPGLRRLTGELSIQGDFVSAVPYGSGHINETYAVTVDQAGTPVRYLVQRINDAVFTRPAALMENVERVTRHVRGRLAAAGVRDLSRRALTLVPARDGRPFVVDPEGGTWRAYLFIEGARTYDVVEGPAEARAAARAFGEYQQLLADLPGGRLHETIPGFHHTRRRFDALQRAVDEDVCNRAADVRAELALIEAREAAVDYLLGRQARGELLERVTHNDTKVNNVMIDDRTREGLAVIDLDTTMPGLVAHDFGDLVRTAAAAAAEDEPDLARVGLRMDVFEAVAEGYLSAARALLTPAERDSLAFGAILITLENGIRFLTDYLRGDLYFRTSRPGHNLDRARSQLAMVASMEANLDAMHRAVDGGSSGFLRLS